MKKGLIIINTGKGKGKTTAALGLAMRACGHDMKVTVLQFIKQANTGEQRAASCLGIEFVAGGAGIISPDNEAKNKRMAIELWRTAEATIRSGSYDMVILDEISYPLRYGWLNTGEVLSVLKNRPDSVHVIVTGRDVPAELIEFADIVTEMNEVKHPLRKGIKAQAGIEF